MACAISRISFFLCVASRAGMLDRVWVLPISVKINAVIGWSFRSMAACVAVMESMASGSIIANTPQPKNDGCRAVYIASSRETRVVRWIVARYMAVFTARNAM